MKCPKCRRYIEDGSESHTACGWNVYSAPDRGYQQCEWNVGGERCKFPGSISTNTHQGGPYYCRFHFGCKDPSYGEFIVAASRDYRLPTDGELDQERVARAKEWLKERGLDKQPHETFAMYRKRTTQYMREKMQTIGKAA